MELAGTEVPIVWRGRRVAAFVPLTLGERDLTLAPSTLASVERALAAVGHLADASPGDGTAWDRELMWAEAVASSSIEGVTAPEDDVLLAEAEPGAARGHAGWVAGNIAALDAAAVAAGTTAPLTVDLGPLPADADKAGGSV